MKTMIFWLRKGCRKPKMHGTATANGSVYAIADFSAMAIAGKGKLFVVDGPTAEHGRRAIAAYLSDIVMDINNPPMTANLENGRIVAIGTNAVLAIGGASEGARNHDARLNRDGIVKVKDTVALGPRSDGIMPTTDDYFGRGFSKDARMAAYNMRYFAWIATQT